MEVYGELAEPSRRLILAELRTGPKTVSELVSATGLKQPNVSNHLSKMRARRTVRPSKVGRQVYYSLSSPEIHAVVVNALAASPEPVRSTALSESAEAYADFAIEGDDVECCRLVDRAISDGQDLLDLYQDLISPAMEIVGRRWEECRIDIDQEHLASSIAERSVARIAQMSVPKRRVPALALVTCAEGSWHTLGLRMLADYLRHQGWKTAFLGPSLPNGAILASVRRLSPRLLLLGCNAFDSIGPVTRLIESLGPMESPPSVGVGGWLVRNRPELLRGVQADFTARDLRTFAEECLPQIEIQGSLGDECRLDA